MFRATVDLTAFEWPTAVSGREFIQLLNRGVLGSVSPINFPSMSVLHAEHCLPSHSWMQCGQNHKRNQQWKGYCYSKTVVVGSSVPSEVPAMNCPCFGCYSAKKPKYFIVVWGPLPSLPYIMLHSSGQMWNCLVAVVGVVLYYFFLISGDLFASFFFPPFKSLLYT